VQGQPVRHGDEFTGFIVDCYAGGDSPENTHRLYDSAFLSRPKGCDRSGLGGRFALFERSEEHTSELRSRENLVCRLLPEKRKAGWRWGAVSGRWLDAAQ